MCCYFEAKASSDCRFTPTFPSTTYSTYPLSNSTRTIVPNNEVNIVSPHIKFLLKLLPISTILSNIVTISVLTIHAMHLRVAFSIGFKAKSFLTISMNLHLLSKEDLKVAHLIFHFLNYVVTKWTVIGQKVDHSHSAGFANI